MDTPESSLYDESSERNGEVAQNGQTCEFCHQVMKPFPTIEKLGTDTLETLFCCTEYQLALQYLIQELIAPFSSEGVEKIDINHHASLSMQSKMKQDLQKWLQAGNEAMLGNEEMYMKALIKKLNMSQSHRVVTTVPVSVTEESIVEESTEVGGQLSGPSLHHAPQQLTEESVNEDSTEQAAHAHPPRQTVQLPAKHVDSIDLFTSTNELETAHMKRCVACGNRFYRNGKNLLHVFPDGTGQAFYPSGNIAILITRTEPIEFTFIIMEDKTIRPQIHAIFKSNGQATCYHRNGLLWVNLDPSGGYYFPPNGKRIHWTWHDFVRHIHAPPFQSINLKLNSFIRIHIISQDQIHLTFSTARNSIVFNIGAKLKLKNPLRVYKERMSTEEQILQQKTLLIRKLLSKIKTSIRNSKSNHAEKIPSKKGLKETSATKVAKPKASQSTCISNRFVQEQLHKKQNSRVTSGTAVKASDSTGKQNSKDQHVPQQTRQIVNETHVVRRGSSTVTNTRTLAKTHSVNIPK